MKYRFYHEWIYRVSHWLGNFHINRTRKYIDIMQKMTDRLKRSKGVVKQ